MPGPLTKVRVVMFGGDEALLRIRAKVLCTIGCDTQVVYSEDQAREEMGPNHARPELVILCHSGEDEISDRLRTMALKAGIPTYTVERLIPPQQLVDDVARVLKGGRTPSKSAKARP